MHVDEHDRIVAFLEKPKDPPACRTSPTWRSPAWASTSSTRSSCSTSCGATPPTESSRDFGKDIIPYLVKHGKAVAHRFADSCVRSDGEAGLLARRRHGRRLLGGQHRPDRRRPGARPLRPATGRSGPMPRSRRRPNSSTTRTAGAAGGRLRWSPAAASSPARRLRRSLLFTGVHVHSYASSKMPWCCPTSTSAAAPG